MLTRPLSLRARGKLRTRQNGAVLLISLIILVAMTLAGIALVRSVDTTNLIAGNLAFKKAATHSGDIGTEAAINWLELNAGGAVLQNDNLPNGYTATRQDPAAGQSWDSFWQNVLAGRSVTLQQNAAGDTVGVDALGNITNILAYGTTVSYAIQRMCNATGPSSNPASGCSVSPVTTVSTANSQDAGTITLQYSGQSYYRITTRIVGPRNTVSYVQTIVTL